MDKKPLDEWYLPVQGVESLWLDVSQEDHCRRVCEGAAEVCNLAADIGRHGVHRTLQGRVPERMQPCHT